MRVTFAGENGENEAFFNTLLLSDRKEKKVIIWLKDYSWVWFAKCPEGYNITTVFK